MDVKKRVFIAWRFNSMVKEILLDNHHIKPISIEAQFITTEKFNTLHDELNSARSDVIAFLHKPNFNDKQMEKLISTINRESNILVLEFSGGSSAVYKEFIDHDNGKLKETNITSDNIEEKLKECVEKCDTTPKLIQLHKRLILEKLDGKPISEAMLDSLKSESEVLKVAINTISEDIRENEEALLDYISDQVVKYGA